MPPRSTMLRAAALAAVALIALLPLAAASAPASSGTGLGTGSGVGNGTLDLSVSPATASVAVNGTAVALSSGGVGLVTLAAGTYLVTAQAGGDQSFEGNVTIFPNASSFLTIHLPAAAGSSGTGGAADYLTAPVVATVIGAAVIAIVGVVLLRPSGREEKPTEPAPAAGPPSTAEEGPE
jgi:hypothetical protein